MSLQVKQFTSYDQLLPASWRSGNDMAVGKGGLGFDYRPGQIGCSVATPATFLQNCLVNAHASSREDRPVTRSMLRHNTASVMKI